MAASVQERSVEGSRSAFVGWCALAVTGQAAQLGVTVAGPYVTYQHIRLPADAGALWWGSAALLALQAALVLRAVFTGATPRAVAWGPWLREHLRPWQVLALLGALLLARAKIARPAEAYAAEIGISSCIALLALANWILAAQALPRGDAERLDGALGAADERVQPGGPDRFAWTAALCGTVATALLAFFVYGRHPHVPDEAPYLIHAEYFAAGKLALSAPPVAEAFDVDLMSNTDGRWFSPVPPGWPIALAAGAFFGAPWLVNPILSGLTLLVAYALAREFLSRRGARLTTLLLLLSPWFLFLGMSFMTHTWTNLCALTAAFAIARARRAKPVLWALLAGLCIGIVSWIRPLDGLVLAAFLGVWAIWPATKASARLPVVGIATLVLTTAAVGALVLPYNRALTGDALLHPIMDYVDRVYGPGKNDLGFGPDKGLDWGGLDPWPGHSPGQAVVNSQFNLFALDVELLGWSAGAVLFMALALLWSPRRRLVRASAAAIAAIVGASCVYWFSGGPDFGARYWYMASVPCTLLVCATFEALRERLGNSAARASVGLALACVGALVTFVPWRAVDKYYHYRGMQPGIRELAHLHHFGKSLVLVRGERHPDYASAAVYNPLDWEADAPVYAWDRGMAVRARLFEHYADRQVWIVDGPSRTGRGFELVGGPLRPEEFAAWEAR